MNVHSFEQTCPSPQLQSPQDNHPQEQAQVQEQDDASRVNDLQDQSPTPTPTSALHLIHQSQIQHQTENQHQPLPHTPSYFTPAGSPWVPPSSISAFEPLESANLNEPQLLQMTLLLQHQQSHLQQQQQAQLQVQVQGQGQGQVEEYFQSQAQVDTFQRPQAQNFPRHQQLQPQQPAFNSDMNATLSQSSSQNQMMPQQLLAGAGFPSYEPIHPAIATLSPDIDRQSIYSHSGSVYAQSPLSASVSTPDSIYQQANVSNDAGDGAGRNAPQHKPPQTIQLDERPRRTRRQAMAIKEKEKRQQEQQSSGPGTSTTTMHSSTTPKPTLQGSISNRRKPHSTGSTATLETTRSTPRSKAPQIRERPEAASASGSSFVLPSSRSGGRLCLNTTDLSSSSTAPEASPASNAVQSPLTIAKGIGRAHPYANALQKRQEQVQRQQARRAVSGPVPTMNASVSSPTSLEKGTVESPTSTANHSPAQSLPAQFSPHLQKSAFPASASAPPFSAPASVAHTPTGEAQAQICQREPRYLPRTDVYHNVENNTITCMLELPGLSAEDIRISLHRQPPNADEGEDEMQLIVHGQMTTLLPNGESVGDEKVREVQESGKGRFVLKERKVGRFRRELVLPRGISVRDITRNYKGGILFLQYPAQPRSTGNAIPSTPPTTQPQNPANSNLTQTQASGNHQQSLSSAKKGNESAAGDANNANDTTTTTTTS